MLRAFAANTVFADVTGEEPSVLALHGWARTRADLRPVVDGLEAIAVDLPGFGASPAPDRPWGSADYAAALDEVVGAMSRRIVVLGHSFGGRVAIQLAARHPDRVAAMVLTGVPLVRLGSKRPPHWRFRLAKKMFRLGLMSEATLDRSRQRHGSADYRHATGVMRDTFVLLVNEDYVDLLPRLACAVDLVWGARDSEVPLAVAEQAATLLPAANVRPVPDAGHLVTGPLVDELRSALQRQINAL